MATGSTNIGATAAGIMKSSDAFELTRELVIDNGTVTKNTYASFTPSVSKSGYTALGVVGWRIFGTGRTWINMSRMYLNTSTQKLGIVLRNSDSTTYTGISVYAYILWVKT